MILIRSFLLLLFIVSYAVLVAIFVRRREACACLILLRPKTPVTPGSVSTALPRSCLIFQRAVRTQENHDIFREKLSVKASLQRPRPCYGARMAFFYIPTDFLVAILCALRVLSLRVHGAHSVCARFHSVATVLTAC